MTYPTGGQGYPPPQQRGPYGPTPPPAKTGDAGGKYPMYLLLAVVILGFAGYLVSFGPMWNTSEMGPVGSTDITGFSFEVIAMVLAALLAAIALLPKQRNYTGIVAIIALFGFLLAMWEMINKPPYLSIGWALIGIVILAALQSVAAIGALLLEAGVISAPQPRPTYDQYPPYGYYGQPTGPTGSPVQQGPPPQTLNQRPGYPQYGGGYPQGPNTGGFPAHGQDAGPPTPPTGFPAYSSPPTQQASTGGSTPTPAPGSAPNAHDQPTQQAPIVQQKSNSNPPPS